MKNLLDWALLAFCFVCACAVARSQDLAPNCTKVFTTIRDEGHTIYVNCASYDRFRKDAAKLDWPKNTQIIVTQPGDNGYSHVVRLPGGYTAGHLVAVVQVNSAVRE